MEAIEPVDGDFEAEFAARDNGRRIKTALQGLGQLHPGATDKVFVSQRHPLGRVSFIDIDSGQVRTLTGFDLNSQIID